MRRILVTMGIIGISLTGYAQNNDKKHSDFDDFRKEIFQNFDDFRDKINREFVEFVRNPWKEFKAEEPIPQPKEEPVPPVVKPIEEEPQPKEDKPIVIEEVIDTVVVTPQPEPVKPIDEIPVVEEKTIDFVFFGTPCSVRFDSSDLFRLKGIDEKAVSNALKKLTSENYNNLIIDCLETRNRLNLCDWAYLELLYGLSSEICGEGTNEATLLMAYLYMQSGYKMRLARNDKRLYMLFASTNIIYGIDCFKIDGLLYYGMEDLPDNLYICDVPFPGEQPLSLIITKQPQFHFDECQSVINQKVPANKITVKQNTNVLSFYSSYPTSYYNDDMMTRWAMYANVPMPEIIRDTLYNTLKTQISGLSISQAVNKLLHFVQTSFQYEFDDKVWGYDRAFFPEETLYYPYCDCEDRSILFTRIVRDLLGLDCLLVYYPGHLASAVQMSNDVKGDHILLNDKKYIICDPTYINAPIGETMPDMDNASAKVILLKR